MKKKVIIAILVLAISAMVYLSFYLVFVGGLIGFLGAKLSGGKKDGIPGRVKSIVLSWRTYELHLHHWLLAALALAIFLPNSIYIVNPQIFYGSMGGLVFQGIYCYSDWHHILKMKPANQSESPNSIDELAEPLDAEEAD